MLTCLTTYKIRTDWTAFILANIHLEPLNMTMWKASHRDFGINLTTVMPFNIHITTKELQFSVLIEVIDEMIPQYSYAWSVPFNADR